MSFAQGICRQALALTYDETNKYRNKKAGNVCFSTSFSENMNQKSRMCLRWSSLLIAHHAAGTMPRRKSNNNTTPPVMQRRRFISCNSFLLLGNKGDFSSLSSHSASKSRLWYEDRTLPMITRQYCAMNNYSNKWPHPIHTRTEWCLLYAFRGVEVEVLSDKVVVVAQVHECSTQQFKQVCDKKECRD